MKNIFYLLFFCLIFVSCQNEDIEIITVPLVADLEIDIFSSQDDCGYTVLNNFNIGSWSSSTLLSDDGNVILCGSGREPFSESQMTVVKTTTIGEVIYFKVLFADRYGDARAVTEDSEQNIYAVGTTYLEEEGFNRNNKLSVAKLDANGAILWENTYQSNLENLTGFSIAILPNDEILIGGSQGGNLAFLKLNPDGEQLDFEIISASPNGYVGRMLLLEDGRILISSSFESQVVLNWFDAELNFLMSKIYPTTWRSASRSTTQLRDGNLITVGITFGDSSGNVDPNFNTVLLLKTDLEGELIWQTTVGDETFFNEGQSIRENEDGSFVLNGHSMNGNMLIHANSDGNEINAKYYPDLKLFEGKNIIKLDNGRNIMTGRYSTGGTFFLNVDNSGR